MEYRSCIMDECGTIMMWCSDMEEDEIYEILEQHPEWSYTTVLI